VGSIAPPPRHRDRCSKTRHGCVSAMCGFDSMGARRAAWGTEPCQQAEIENHPLQFTSGNAAPVARAAGFLGLRTVVARRAAWVVPMRTAHPEYPAPRHDSARLARAGARPRLRRAANGRRALGGSTCAGHGLPVPGGSAWENGVASGRQADCAVPTRRRRIIKPSCRRRVPVPRSWPDWPRGGPAAPSVPVQTGQRDHARRDTAIDRPARGAARRA